MRTVSPCIYEIPNAVENSTGIEKIPCINGLLQFKFILFMGQLYN